MCGIGLEIKKNLMHHNRIFRVLKHVTCGAECKVKLDESIQKHNFISTIPGLDRAWLAANQKQPVLHK